MEEHGYTVQMEDAADLTAIKTQYHVPLTLYSCHTAIVDGYVIEGHVPVADMERLLRERPEISGIAVAGMPLGSPGMPTNGAVAQPYDVVAFDESGPLAVWASYDN